MAGPNDHHIDTSGQLQPGLGKDEPNEAIKAAARRAGAAEIEAQKAELAKHAEGLSSLERDLLAQQEAQAKKATELEEREKALLKAEAEAAAKKGGAK